MTITYNIVYKVTSEVNGKIYIGQTSQTLARRRNDHEHKARQVVNGKKKHIMPFTLALAKHGKENFKWEILAKDLSSDEANQLEQDEIKKVGDNGYNLASGGKEYYVHSEETKAKIREHALAKWQDPEYVVKFKAGVKATKETTLAAVRASYSKISVATKKAYEDPEVKERARLSKIEAWDDEERRKEASERMTKIWANPDKKDERSKSIKVSRATGIDKK